MTDGLREFLKKPRSVLRALQKNNAELESLMSSVLPQAIVYDKDKVQTTPADPMLRYAEEYESLYRKGAELIDEYLRARDAVKVLTDSLDPEQGLIVTRRFINDEDFETIAAKVSMSIRTVYRIYDNAVVAMEDCPELWQKY